MGGIEGVAVFLNFPSTLCDKFVVLPQDEGLGGRLRSGGDKK